MKNSFVLSIFIVSLMIFSCQRQDSGAEAQLAQRKTELDARDIKIENAPGAGVSPRGQNEAHFVPEGLTLDQYEQEIIREALKRAEGNKSHAARLLGLTRNALR